MYDSDAKSAATRNTKNSRQNKHVRQIVIRRDSLGNRPGSPERRTRFSGEPPRFPRESLPPDPRLRRHACISTWTPREPPLIRAFGSVCFDLLLPLKRRSG